VLGCEVVCEEERGDIGTERLLQVVEPELVTWTAGHHVASSCVLLAVYAGYI
jgi:hypothetical protein